MTNSKKIYQQRLASLNQNPVTFASSKFSKQKYSAITNRNIAWRLNKEKTIKLIVETEFCKLSGRELVFEIGHPDSPSIDRIDSNKGYTKSNIQIVGAQVNKSKNDMSDEEFVQMCVDVARHHGYIND